LDAEESLLCREGMWQSDEEEDERPPQEGSPLYFMQRYAEIKSVHLIIAMVWYRNERTPEAPLTPKNLFRSKRKATDISNEITTEWVSFLYCSSSLY
jgi:hypothetical protein